ncbi:MAG: hypothetical protein HC852_02795 [Acaryochloridaceae cyanobacterium RU_4_10]|nr:hypothetical protein [Acaryochloridaceae cyanobacterium RU_4_10]
MRHRSGRASFRFWDWKRSFGLALVCVSTTGDFARVGAGVARAGVGWSGLAGLLLLDAPLGVFQASNEKFNPAKKPN